MPSDPFSAAPDEPGPVRRGSRGRSSGGPVPGGPQRPAATATAFRAPFSLLRLSVGARLIAAVLFSALVWAMILPVV
ncbi:hypothetical protein [Methylobrevis albus]|uniref:Uncharacterized protein n=1 Tax=Methylobrevis albus TaxID=2793297 RepID=A0A931I4W4_9HYPH|nr:hypothetical protein [Methylobrevis albus]MBH0239328.1 hypothetical protein [Methylobrevis albus]